MGRGKRARERGRVSAHLKRTYRPPGTSRTAGPRRSASCRGPSAGRRRARGPVLGRVRSGGRPRCAASVRCARSVDSRSSVSVRGDRARARRSEHEAASTRHEREAVRPERTGVRLRLGLRARLPCRTPGRACLAQGRTPAVLGQAHGHAGDCVRTRWDAVGRGRRDSVRTGSDGVASRGSVERGTDISGQPRVRPAVHEGRALTRGGQGGQGVDRRCPPHADGTGVPVFRAVPGERGTRPHRAQYRQSRQHPWA